MAVSGVSGRLRAAGRRAAAAAPGARGGAGSGCVRAGGAPPRERGSRAAAAAEPRDYWEGLPAVVAQDPLLGGFEAHWRRRWGAFGRALGEVGGAEGSLAAFAQGYLRFGLVPTGEGGCAGGLVFREWAPGAAAARLCGDFEGGGGAGLKLARDQLGVWEGQLPQGVPHLARVRLRLQRADGQWEDRVPAWARYTIPGEGFGAPYDMAHWAPPPEEAHRWAHERPPPPSSLRIYEAHVGMSSEHPRVGSYRDFADHVLPRIKRTGYTAVQLMAVQEHAYYASFGYQVTNFFAPSSRCGTPEDLKYLVDTAHGLGLLVLMDVVHSHAADNPRDGLGEVRFGWDGPGCGYFPPGLAGNHPLWGSRVFDYGAWEVRRFLLSNLRWWMEEFRFDGFRFDGVTSMLYHHHGAGRGFSGSYADYFSDETNEEAVVYLMLANRLLHELVPDAVSVAEDVSGMPALGRPVGEGGLGFDYRLGMAVPDKWIELLKDRRDEDWGMEELMLALCNRRYTEKTVGYCESHDQSIVGDQTIAFRLMGSAMYDGMSALEEISVEVERGLALHKCIRLLTMSLGGEAYLTFMGNEFGHPEWVDFPREGNGWSHDKCRRMWSLADTPHLRYKFLLAFEEAMHALDDAHAFLASPHQVVSTVDEATKLLVVERGPLVFVFNFHPTDDLEGLRVGCGLPGKYKVVLDSDAFDFGGKGRVSHDAEHFTEPEDYKERPCSMHVFVPARCTVAYARDED